MAKSLKIITSICMCVFISIAFFACSSNASDEKSTSEGAFTIYVVKDTPINSLIKKYNENKKFSLIII